MQYTIYFGPKRLIISKEVPVVAGEKEPVGRKEIFTPVNDQAIHQAIEQISSASVSTAVLVHAKPDEVLEKIKSRFQFVQAAGGLVQNNDHKILLIYRNSKWDLPKGKLDPGEDLPACAVREVQEETGLKTVSIVRPIGATYHTYYQDRKMCLKESNWYLMHTVQQDNLVPQAEEGIEQCQWTDPDKLEPYLRQTHPSIADILREGLLLLR